MHANASTERPTTKRGGSKLARRSYMADLSTTVPPFFARPQAQKILRRKAPHICAPQAKKIFSTTSDDCFYEEIWAAACAHLA